MWRRVTSPLVLTVALVACGGTPPAASPPIDFAPGTIPVAPTARPSALVPTAPVSAAPTASAASTVASGTVSVELGDHFFAPQQITVRRGTTVRWVHVGSATHDVAAKDGAFTNENMGPGSTFSYTFNRAGTFPVICKEHEGDGMVSEVIVVD